ncbi:hypothetical protein T4B_9429 [Trichinella pseudospiralis]|uniref:Uncharacterized protein n=1 Tax=Trichinella pseudospiralis TaxID=6337 RepID=A0A0V1HQ81_TRIPS|nr:hypothetical protein T4B_9429 [Trichinella pseudospiralis]
MRCYCEWFMARWGFEKKIYIPKVSSKCSAMKYEMNVRTCFDINHLVVCVNVKVMSTKSDVIVQLVSCTEKLQSNEKRRKVTINCTVRKSCLGCVLLSMLAVDNFPLREVFQQKEKNRTKLELLGNRKNEIFVA